MDQQATLDILERLGAVRRGHFRAGEQHTDLAAATLEPLTDPTATNQLATALAAALPQPAPDVVLVWAGPPSVLLGFLVGIALDRRVVRLADDEGVVYASAPLEPGQRVALVGDLLTERQVRLARAFAASRGVALSSVAALVDDGRAGEVVALAALQDHRFPADNCPLCRLSQPIQGLPGSSAASSTPDHWR